MTVVQLAQDKWEHVAMVYDGAALSMFLNGEQVSSQGVTGEWRVCSNTNPAMVGEE